MRATPCAPGRYRLRAALSKKHETLLVRGSDGLSNKMALLRGHDSCPQGWLLQAQPRIGAQATKEWWVMIFFLSGNAGSQARSGTDVVTSQGTHLLRYPGRAMSTHLLSFPRSQHHSIECPGRVKMPARVLRASGLRTVSAHCVGFIPFPLPLPPTFSWNGL